MSDTTTVSEPRPVSALEQTLRDIASSRPVYYGLGEYGFGKAQGYAESADLVHARDAPLWALVRYCEDTATAPALTDGAEYTRGYKTACADIADGLRDILEGKSS